MAKSPAAKCPIRRRWTAADALAALALSGLSVRAFASRASLDAQRLYVWRRRLAGRTRRSHKSERADLPLQSPKELSTAGSCGSGMTVRAPPCPAGHRALFGATRP